MSSTAIAKQEDWGTMGDAMRALPNERWRDFVRHYVLDYERGAAGRAYLAAGYKASEENARTDAWKLLQDQRVIDAVAEESRKIMRSAHPDAVRALLRVINDPDHKDHVRAISMLLDRADPIETRQSMTVEHKVTLSADEEALQELVALRQLNVARDKLIELFGWNGLERLEKLEAKQDTKLIEAKVVENG